jgi:hypothetical protein
MKRLVEAFKRLSRRFDFGGNARAEQRARNQAKAKRPPKRKRRR